MVNTDRSIRPRKQVRVSVTRLDLLMQGELKMEDLDDEEVRRMQLRNSQGDFRGKPPLWIPRALAMEFQQEQFRRFQSEMSQMVPDALKAVKDLVNSRYLAPGDATRLRAAETVFERVFGKVTQSVDSHVVVDRGPTFDDVLEGVLVDVEEDDA